MNVIYFDLVAAAAVIAASVFTALTLLAWLLDKESR